MTEMSFVGLTASVKTLNGDVKMHTYGFHSCKHLSGPPLQLPAGILTTQPGGFAGGEPAGDVSWIFTGAVFIWAPLSHHNRRRAL